MTKTALIALIVLFVFAATAAAQSNTNIFFANETNLTGQITAFFEDSCPNDYQRVIDGNCVKVCDTNEFYTDDGECHLRDCGIGRIQTYHACMNTCYGGEVWDLRTQRCTHANCNIFQYLDQNGICTYLECPAGYRWDDYRVLCLRNSCPLGSSRDASGTCVLGCDANQYYDSYYGKCRPHCLESENYNEFENKCDSKCGSASHWVNGACIPNVACTNGFQFINEHCICPEYHHVDQNGACIDDYQEPQCPTGQQYSQSAMACICNNENEIIQNGVCVAVCNENDYYLSSNHECHSTYCGPGRTQLHHACMNTCLDNESWDTRSNTCSKSSNCSILQYINENGACTDFACPAGYHYDTQHIVCISNTCPIGRYRNSNGDCVECPAGQHVENGACVLTCAAGQHAENGVCIADIPECLEGQHLENNACVNDTNEQAPDVNSQEPADNSFPVPFPVAELGNCSSRSDCEAYCNVPGNVVACLDFAEANGLMTGAELAEARKMVQYILAGTTPGHCASQQQCDAYCDKQENLQECVNFAVTAGIITQQEADIAIKTGGVGPGGCKRDECKTYCDDQAHFTECVDFAVANGMMDAKEAEMAKKTGGKGPGGCQKDECNTYCNTPEHQQECFKFAVDNGLIPAGNVEMMTECMKSPDACNAYCNASDEKFASCVKMWEENAGGNGPSAEDLRRMKLNYYESPGNCKGNRQCVEAYCKDGIPAHSIECEQFQVKMGEKTQEQFDQWQQNFDANRNSGPTEGPIDKPGCPPVQAQAMACYNSGNDAVLVTDAQGCMIMTGCQPKMTCPQGQHWENNSCMSDNQTPSEYTPSGCEIEAPPCNAGPPVCVNNHWECTPMPSSSGSGQGFSCSSDQHLENGVCVPGTAPGTPPTDNGSTQPPTDQQPQTQEPAPAPPVTEPAPSAPAPETPTGQVIAVSKNIINSIIEWFGFK